MVQRHGLYHGVEVFVEIDMPGHTGSIQHSHPELITAYNARPWSTFAQEPPAGQLKLNSPEVHSLVRTLLKDLIPRIVPYTSIFHIGGDEINKECYRLDDTVRSADKAVIKPHLQSFMVSIYVSLGLMIPSSVEIAKPKHFSDNVTL